MNRYHGTERLENEEEDIEDPIRKVIEDGKDTLISNCIIPSSSQDNINLFVLPSKFSNESLQEDQKNLESDDVPLTMHVPSIQSVYDEAVTLGQKIEIIIKAVEYFYPKTKICFEGIHNRFLMKTNPLSELTPGINASREIEKWKSRCSDLQKKWMLDPVAVY